MSAHIINPGFALKEAAREANLNPERAVAWERVLQDMLSHTLHVGSRTPTGDPAWVTPRVLEGGFAVPGQRMAGGKLLDHELLLLQQLQEQDVVLAKHDAAGVLPSAQQLQAEGEGIPDDTVSRVRVALNHWSVSNEGMLFWLERLSSGCLRICQPEEGACLAVTLLIQADKEKEAQDVLREIMPWFGALRFYPRLADTPVPEGDSLSRSSVAELHSSLEHVCEPTPQILLQMWAMEHRWPLYDELVQMVKITEGTQPGSWLEIDTKTRGSEARRRVKQQLLTFKEKERAALVIGKVAASGPKGYELQHPALHANRTSWHKRRRVTRTGADQLAAEPVDGFLPRSMRKDGYSVLRAGLERFALGRDTPKDRERVASVMRTREEAAQRRTQAKAHLPKCYKFALIRDVVLVRLQQLPPDSGIPVEKLDRVLAPVTEKDVAEISKRKGSTVGLQPGDEVPDTLAEKCKAAKCAPLEQMVEEGIVPSAEVLAAVVKPLVAAARTVDIQDPLPRRLAQMLIRAFSNRRSLLLLDMQAQVNIRELPWYSALTTNFAGQAQAPTEAPRPEAKKAKEDDFGVLSESEEESTDGLGKCMPAALQLVRVCIKYFGGQTLPNELISQLQPLLPGVPLIKMVAADIFMDEFHPKYVVQAQALADPTTGVADTAYERYFGLEEALASLRSMRSAKDVPRHEATGVAWEFYRLCKERSDKQLGAPVMSYTIAAGAMIEQAALLTSHNYHMLLTSLGLDDDHALMLAGMDSCLHHLRELLKRGGAGDSDNPKAKLHIASDAASAVRNLMLFASILEKAGHNDVVVSRLQAFLKKHAAASSPENQERLLLVQAAKADAAAAKIRVHEMEMKDDDSERARLAEKRTHAKAQAGALENAASVVRKGEFSKLTPEGLGMPSAAAGPPQAGGSHSGSGSASQPQPGSTSSSTSQPQAGSVNNSTSLSGSTSQRAGLIRLGLGAFAGGLRRTGQLVQAAVLERQGTQGGNGAEEGCGCGVHAGMAVASSASVRAGAGEGVGEGGVPTRPVREDVRVFPGLVVVVAGLLASVQGVKQEGGLGCALMGYTLESTHWLLKCSNVGAAPAASG